MDQAPIFVTVITGFLGAGKSTLVQTWLQELPRDETAVIVNERGEVGIDGELLAAHVARLREISGGCVCCSSQAELLHALSELSATEPRPGRILVETSGAASPAGVIRALGAPRARERLQLDGVITVLDATRAQQALAFDVAVEQLGFADVVVLSHVDEVEGNASRVDLEQVQELVQRHAPAAVVTRARRGMIGASFLELLARRAEALKLPAAGTGHTSIEAVSLVLDGELDEERFGAWVEDALGTVEAHRPSVGGGGLAGPPPHPDHLGMPRRREGVTRSHDVARVTLAARPPVPTPLPRIRGEGRVRGSKPCRWRMCLL